MVSAEWLHVSAGLSGLGRPRCGSDSSRLPSASPLDAAPPVRVRVESGLAEGCAEGQLPAAAGLQVVRPGRRSKNPCFL